MNADAQVRVLVCASGSGGHLFPARYVIESLQARGAQVCFVGAGAPLEQEIIASTGGVSQIHPVQTVMLEEYDYSAKIQMVDSGDQRGRYVYLLIDGDGFVIHFMTDRWRDREDWPTLFYPILQSFRHAELAQ